MSYVRVRAPTDIRLVACIHGCFKMFACAASASATKSVSRGAQSDQVGRDLTGQDRKWPFAFEDDPAALSMYPEDLSVPNSAVTAPFLAPALGTS